MIVCDACFRRLYPKGREEKTCCHGVFAGVVCVECGKKRETTAKPYWHCLS